MDLSHAALHALGWAYEHSQPLLAFVGAWLGERATSRLNMRAEIRAAVEPIAQKVARIEKFILTTMGLAAAPNARTEDA